MNVLKDIVDDIQFTNKNIVRLVVVLTSFSHGGRRVRIYRYCFQDRSIQGWQR